MTIEITTAKTILRRHKRVDSWFLSRYGMNLFRGCTHACAYCDGRAEQYRVPGVFDRDIQVKENAAEVLAREIDPSRRRKPMKRGFVLLGGGVSDSYQPLERQVQITRSVLEVLAESAFPVHVLTKSNLVLRDLDLLLHINERRTLVSMSLSTVDDELARVFEPGCPSPTERLAALRKLGEAGIATGVFLMPVVPGMSDSAAQIDAAVAAAKDAGVSFVTFGGMTLKPGRQTSHFMEVMQRHDAAGVPGVQALYDGNQWGHPPKAYHAELNRRFGLAVQRHAMPPRIPPHLWWPFFDENDRVIVILEHLQYVCDLQGRPSSYRWAANAIAKLREPISEWRDRLCELSGVGSVTERLILEILDTERCRFYEQLLERPLGTLDHGKDPASR